MTFRNMSFPLNDQWNQTSDARFVSRNVFLSPSRLLLLLLRLRWGWRGRRPAWSQWRSWTMWRWNVSIVGIFMRHRVTCCVGPTHFLYLWERQRADCLYTCRVLHFIIEILTVSKCAFMRGDRQQHNVPKILTNKFFYPMPTSSLLYFKLRSSTA